MKALLLVILLAHGGFWFGGAANSITVRWSAPEAGMPAAVLKWSLCYGTVVLVKNETDVAAVGPTNISVTLPEVRTMGDYAWRYELKEKASGKLLEQGEQIIHACPTKLLEDTAKRLGNTRVYLLETGEGLGNVLKEARIEVRKIGSAADLEMQKPDIVLLGENALPQSEAAQQVFLDKAHDGARVLVLSQTKVKQALGLPLRSRVLKGPLTWRGKHELFDRLDVEALEAWTRGQAQEAMALALPADAPMLELGFFSRETPGTEPVPIDALVATQTVGTGRIVWWQLPVESWNDDPRSTILLDNAFDYLLTRPEPTLPPSKRKPADADKATQPAAKDNLLPTGVQR